MKPVDWRDHLFGFSLCVAYVAVLLPTSRDLAMSRDESFYVSAADNIAGWLEQLSDDQHAARHMDALTRGWEFNHEHPPLMKTAFALSSLAQQKWHVFPVDSQAYRFPGMLVAGLLLWLLYVFGARAFSRNAGAFAALAYALLPRPFYHAHLDCFDVPITFMLTLVTYCYWRSLTRPWWALWTGVTYGLALATKHNAWILPGVLLVHWIWVAIAEVRSRRAGAPKRVSLVPWWLITCAVLGPPIFVGSWPWLWWETWPRVQEYVGFHLHHTYYNMAYFGVNYFSAPSPSSYPFVMTAITVPTTTLVLALCGLGSRVPAMRKSNADPACTEVLLLGCILAPLLAIALPSSPIFGGTKHWFPAYPPLMLFAGVGFVRVLEVVEAALPSLSGRYARLVAPFVGLFLLTPAAVETAHSHPFGLSNYVPLIGGAPGAADLGMNRQFWGFTTGSLVPWLVEHMPDGGSVWLCDTTWGSWGMLQRDGVAPRNIRAASTMADADYAIVHHEMHVAEVDYQIWTVYGHIEPAYVLTYDGVPIISVYESPRHAAVYSRAP